MTIGTQTVEKYGVLCFGGEDWWYHNRGHADMQFMQQLAHFGPVVYVNSIVMRKPNIGEGRLFLRRVSRKVRSVRRGLVHVTEHFSVYSPLSAPVHHWVVGRTINKALLRAQIRVAMQRVCLRRPLVWVNCPAACDVACTLTRNSLVYQRSDRYEDFPGVDRCQISRYDRRLKSQANLTFFSNYQLYEEERTQCRKAAYVDHGVDYELFASAKDDPLIPSEMQGLRHPIAGFVGGIDAHTFDLSLILDVIRLLPEWTFVFVGHASIDCSELMKCENVLLTGKRGYEEVPHYGKCFDVCLMPWNQNRWIEACNPIKLKEYLALGKPIVTTPFPELASYGGLVHIATTGTEFAEGIRASLRENSGALEDLRRERVQRHTWAARCRELLGLLND